MMDFQKLMNVASKNERKAQKELTSAKPGLATKLTPAKREVKCAKGVQSAAVRAFLAKKEKEEQEKAAAEDLKKTELMRLRHEARHERKAHAMASRTKDNPKVFSSAEDKTAETRTEPVVDLKHLFTKHDRRVPHLPSEKIPDVLSMMKERQRQRKLAREEARNAAEDETLKRQKLDDETIESDVKHEKHSAPSRPASDHKLQSTAVSAELSKSVRADKRVDAKVKVKKTNRPPPMSFEQLMALAEQKQSEPVIDAEEPINVPKKVCTEQERPMTQEEKDRQKRRETKEYQDWLRYGGPPPGTSSSGKSQHQQCAGEYRKGQRMTVSSKKSGSDAFDESDSETDQTCNTRPQAVSGKKSHSNTGANTLKDGVDIAHKQSSTVKSYSEKLFSGQNDSGHRPVKPSRPVSRPEVLFTKGKVVPVRTGNGGGQNGKLSSLSDELIEKLKEERRKMVDSGDAVPSLADMLQDLLNKVRGGTDSQEPTTKQLVSSGSRSLNPSSCRTKSQKSIFEQNDKPVKSVPGGARSQSTLGGGVRPSYITVNETVVDCAPSDKSGPPRPVKSGDKRPPKSTWDEMYERAESKNPHLHRDRERKRVRQPRRVDDSSEDEVDDDDDMDDFIDDGSDVEHEDYSHYIRELFGYDRRKYANEKDDDLRGMESSYSQLLKEDAVSTKLGLLEDLEDMRKEEEEKLQKLGKLKAKKPRLK